MHPDTRTYNKALDPDHQKLCDLLAKEIDRFLPDAENKVWHAHPVWFLDGNPTVGYSKQKPGIRLMFWSGADFDEPGLNIVGKKFKDASVFLNDVSDVKKADLRRWLEKAQEIQWDYKNLVKRKGRLERVEYMRSSSFARIRSARILAVIIAVCAAAPLPAQQADTLRMTLRWEVSEGVHPTADSLGRLSGVAMDAGGVVYVSDIADARIWVFAPDGKSLRSIGRKGRGPGEFESPTGIGIAPDGKLYVRDAVHVSRFGTDPETGRLTRFEESFRGPPFADWYSPLATRFDRAGHLYYPSFNNLDRSARTGWFRRFTLGGEQRDSLEVPAFPSAPSSTAYVRLDATGGRMLSGLNHVPFEPLPVWDVTPRGTLLSGDGRSYLLRETDAAGRLVREYRRAVQPERIPPRERRDSLAALSARLDSITVPWSQVQGVPPAVRARQLPEHYPPFLAAYAAEDGRVWVRRWVANSDARTVFDVFEADGRFSRVVQLPRRVAIFPTPVLTLQGIVAIGVDPETGAHSLLRFDAPRPRQ